MTYCLRTDCPDHGHAMVPDCDFGLCPCKDCDRRISPIKTDSNSSQLEPTRHEIGEVVKLSEAPPASVVACEVTDGSSSGGAPTGGVSFGQGYTYADESGIKRFTATSTSSFLSELMPLIGQKPKRLMAIPEIDVCTMYLFEPGPDSARVYEVIGSERLRGLNEPMVIISRRLRDQLACLGYSDGEISRAVESLIRKQNGAKP